VDAINSFTTFVIFIDDTLQGSEYPQGDTLSTVTMRLILTESIAWKRFQINGAQAVVYCVSDEAACLSMAMMKVSVTRGAKGYKIFLAVVT
jgi:hypothetical protein